MEFIEQLPKLNGLSIIDTHIHYDDDMYANDVDLLLEKVHQYGVSRIITSGTGNITNKKAVELAEKYDYVYATVGLHPELIDDNSQINIEQYLKHPKVVAVGEIGLDYHYRDDNKDVQKALFEQQIELAIKYNMPIVVHDRDAHNDTMQILNKYKPKGTVHCYSGSVEMAREIVKLGMFLGIGGVVTFKNARKTVEVVEQIPLDNIVLETDGPYLAPPPYRGKRNHSAFISLVAQRIAEIKKTSIKQVLDVTSQNAINLYNLK
ncbi:MAG: TatD family hydrolase [Acutalibacteraceae bacterium]|nr:TatD family hydrolase [Acutalibacteraceae bacterium]